MSKLKCTSQNIIKVYLGRQRREILVGWVQTDGVTYVSNVESALLTAPFVEEEIKNDVFQTEYNKAPGTDRFPAKFYQNF